MSVSPWGASPRRGLRVGLALVLAFDATIAANALSHAEVGEDSIRAVPWLLALGGRPLVVWALAAVAYLAAFMFARARRPIASGLVALAVLGALVGALTALQAMVPRNFYVTGTAVTGWLVGELVEWARRRRGEPVASPGALPEAGAAGALAAMYLSAAVSKLTLTGAEWLSPVTLESLVLTQHSLSDQSLLASYMRLVATTPSLATALAGAALVMQLFAPVWLIGPRLRAAWGTLFLAFHLNVFLLTGIPYLEPFALVLLFSYPWPKLAARLRRQAPGGEVEAPERGPALALVAIPLALALLGLAARTAVPEPLRFVSGSLNAPAARSSRPAEAPLARFGPLAVGEPLADGWRLDALELRGEEMRFWIARQDQRLYIAVVPSVERARGVFARDGADAFHEQTKLPLEQFDAAGKRLMARLAEAAGSRPLSDALRAWVAAR